MKKLILLAVLIFAFSVGIASAENFTGDLKFKEGDNQWAVKLSGEYNTSGDGIVFEYTLGNWTNLSGYSGYPYSIYSLILQVPNATDTSLWSEVYPDGWEFKVADGFVSWAALPGTAGIQKGGEASFSLFASGSSATTRSGAFADGADQTVFSGKTLVPKFPDAPPTHAAVPEASTLVGFGSALFMAGPGMLSYLRKRRQ